MLPKKALTNLRIDSCQFCANIGVQLLIEGLEILTHENRLL